MKKLFTMLLFIGAIFLGYKQYKFNLQIEWWTATKSTDDECSWYETIIPMNIMVEENLGNYKNGKYAVGLKMWKENVESKRKEVCTEHYDRHSLNPHMPFTDDWHKFRKETGLSSIYGYLKELGKDPLKVDGKSFENHAPTVILRNHWYGGGEAKCFIIQAGKITGSPLPLLSRTLYELDCKNEKSIKLGIHGFSAISTIDNLEVIK